MTQSIASPFLLGFSTGLRSVTPLAMLSWFGPSKLRRLHSPLSKGLFTTAALAEIVNDKLPGTPSRTQTPLLLGRLVLGGVAGYLVTRHINGVLLGAAGALAGTYGGYYVRRALTRPKRFADLPVALEEDVLAVGVAYGAVAL